MKPGQRLFLGSDLKLGGDWRGYSNFSYLQNLSYTMFFHYRKTKWEGSTGKFLCPFHALIYFCLVITKIIQMVNTLRLECISRASLVAQMVKNLPAVLETWVQFLGQEDPLEKGMATHSSILAWRIPWTEEPGRLQSMGPQRDMTEWLTLSECVSKHCCHHST